MHPWCRRPCPVSCCDQGTRIGTMTASPAMALEPDAVTDPDADLDDDMNIEHPGGGSGAGVVSTRLALNSCEVIHKCSPDADVAQHFRQDILATHPHEHWGLCRIVHVSRKDDRRHVRQLWTDGTSPAQFTAPKPMFLAGPHHACCIITMPRRRHRRLHHRPILSNPEGQTEGYVRIGQLCRGRNDPADRGRRTLRDSGFAGSQNALDVAAGNDNATLAAARR